MIQLQTKKQRSFDYCSPNKASDKAACKQICCLIYGRLVTLCGVFDIRLRLQRSSGWKQDLGVNPAQLSHDTGASNTPPQSCSLIERCQLFCPVKCLLDKSICQIWRYDRFYGKGLKHRSGVTQSYKTKIGLCILCLISRGTRSFARARSGTCGFSGVPPWPLFVDSASALGFLYIPRIPCPGFQTFNWRPLHLKSASSKWAKFFKNLRPRCGRSQPRIVIDGSIIGRVASVAGWPSNITAANHAVKLMLNKFKYTEIIVIIPVAIAGLFSLGSH